ncbi:MAG: hypothetical protein KY467_02510 [Gemmatimonadetes bacterium]|nr:hypothetical protein [Gemmatimonadota bacterium]
MPGEVDTAWSNDEIVQPLAMVSAARESPGARSAAAAVRTPVLLPAADVR